MEISVFENASMVWHVVTLSNWPACMSCRGEYSMSLFDVKGHVGLLLSADCLALAPHICRVFDTYIY